MRVRSLDAAGDWLFGKGQNDYLTANAAVVQNISTRLLMFLGDCFFDTAAGIDWFNLLGAKNETALSLAVAAVILNTEEVTALNQLSIGLDVARNLTIKFQVQTIYSKYLSIAGQAVANLNQIG